MSSRSLLRDHSALRRTWLRASVSTILLAAMSCGGSTTAPATTALHAEVSDRTGDAVPDPGVPVSPDLVHGTVDVSAGNITIAVQFAPGTFDRSTSRLTIELDTDQSASTGLRTADGLGVEYALDVFAPANQASILKAVTHRRVHPDRPVLHTDGCGASQRPRRWHGCHGAAVTCWDCRRAIELQGPRLCVETGRSGDHHGRRHARCRRGSRPRSVGATRIRRSSGTAKAVPYVQRCH